MTVYRSDAFTNWLYMPRVGKGPTPRTDVGGQGSPDDPAALKVFNLAVADPNQHRQQLVWNPVLAAVAQARCEDMLKRGYFDHVDPDGKGPNWHVIQAGYRLSYGAEHDDANEIESIGLNYQSAAACWQGWLDSSAHRLHVLAEIDFFARQTQIGVGFAWHSATETYPALWCFLSCPPEGS